MDKELQEEDTAQSKAWELGKDDAETKRPSAVWGGLSSIEGKAMPPAGSEVCQADRHSCAC